MPYFLRVMSEKHESWCDKTQVFQTWLMHVFQTWSTSEKHESCHVFYESSLKSMCHDADMTHVFETWLMQVFQAWKSFRHFRHASWRHVFQAWLMLWRHASCYAWKMRCVVLTSLMFIRLDSSWKTRNDLYLSGMKHVFLQRHASFTMQHVHKKRGGEVKYKNNQDVSPLLCMVSKRRDLNNVYLYFYWYVCHIFVVGTVPFHRVRLTGLR